MYDHVVTNAYALGERERERVLSGTFHNGGYSHDVTIASASSSNLIAEDTSKGGDETRRGKGRSGVRKGRMGRA